MICRIIDRMSFALATTRLHLVPLDETHLDGLQPINTNPEISAFSEDLRHAQLYSAWRWNSDPEERRIRNLAVRPQRIHPPG